MRESAPEGMASAVLLSIVAAVVFVAALVFQSNPIAIVSMLVAGTAAIRFAWVFQGDARRRAEDPELHLGDFEREMESLPLQLGTRVGPGPETESPPEGEHGS